MKPSDGAKLRKLTIRLSILLKTGLGEIESLSIFELFEIAEEVAEAYGK